MEFLLIILLIIIVVIIWGLIEKRIHKNELLELNKERKNLSKSEFVENFISKGYDYDVISKIYDELILHIGIENFVILPEDDLHKICNLHDLDDIELIDRICQNLEIEKPSQKDFDSLADKYDYLNFESLLELARRLKKNE
jgi:hypothetical protein